MMRVWPGVPLLAVVVLMGRLSEWDILQVFMVKHEILGLSWWATEEVPLSHSPFCTHQLGEGNGSTPINWQWQWQWGDWTRVLSSFRVIFRVRGRR